ncbi:cell differentiation protein RCD1 [Trichuris trichiura]|uniref:CCR4-NOT transcription complex subunit 9 n=1 Tax=Trichuris trichiura TaxID=36087 RepID=A0A077ZEB6_TRITR|nr:cell differentiation protein RCD1 [Trichuris trichiura]
MQKGEGNPHGNKAGYISMDQVNQWMEEIKFEGTQEVALMRLAQNSESIPHLGVMLWNAPGAVTLLLREILSVYPFMNPPIVTTAQSNRVCNSLSLMQTIATDPLTQSAFLNAKLPFYVFPFLTSVCTSPAVEYLRLTSLGVIGSLVKGGNPEAIHYLLSTEIISLCLNTMEVGRELSKTVATFILQKLLLEDGGLCHVCGNYDRFFRVVNTLVRIVYSMGSEPPARLLKQVIRCFCRLSENPYARDTLQYCLPVPLTDPAFTSCSTAGDRQTELWLARLLEQCHIKSK